MTDTTTAAPVSTGPASRNVTGYAVRIVGFMPVDTSDPDKQIAAAQIIKQAIGGDITALAAAMGDIELTQKFTARRVAITPAAPTPPAADPNEPELPLEGETGNGGDTSDLADPSGENDNGMGATEEDEPALLTENEATADAPRRVRR